MAPEAARLRRRRGRAPQPGWRRRRAAPWPARAPRASAAEAGGAARASFASCSRGRDGEGGGGRSPSANGQPDESFTRHQPRSIPRMPQRGRECQCRHSPSPMSSFETRIHRWSSGEAIIDSISTRLASSASARAPSSCWASRSLTTRASRTRSSSPTPSTRGPPRAPTRHSIPWRGKADAKASPSFRSSLAIWRRRSSRTRRSEMPEGDVVPPAEPASAGVANGIPTLVSLSFRSSGIPLLPPVS